MKLRARLPLALFLLAGSLLLCTCRTLEPPFEVPAGNVVLSFAVAADMRDFAGDDPALFRGACERLASGGAGDFILSPGDIDPPQLVLATIRSYLDADIPWYPVVGNHEAETPEDMAWLRAFNPAGTSLPHVVKPGPAQAIETMYSFDRANVHIAVINEYADAGGDAVSDVGDITATVQNWLDADLAATSQSVIFVVGHEPAYPQPDMDNGRVRHLGDSLDLNPTTRDQFWNSLAAHGVRAYITGHTHNTSLTKQGAVWQVDAGHSRGTGDTGARSTFLMFYVMDDGAVWVYVYRQVPMLLRYELTARISLD